MFFCYIDFIINWLKWISLYSLTKISPFLTPSKHTLEYNFVYIIVNPIGCFGGIGALLGLLGLSLLNGSSRDKETRKIDTSRLLLLGLPASIISLAHVWGYLGFSHSSRLLFIPPPKWSYHHCKHHSRTYARIKHIPNTSTLFHSLSTSLLNNIYPR